MNSEAPKSPLSVFLLVADLSPHGRASPLVTLASGLPRESIRAAVGVLGDASGAQAAALRSAGVSVHALPIRSLLDLSGFRRLRDAVRAEQPAVIHAWGSFPAAIAGWLVGRDRSGRNSPRLAVSSALDPQGGLWGWVAARRLRRADRIVPANRAEGERYHQAGVPSERLTLIGPAVALSPAEIGREALCKRFRLPGDAQLIVAGGRSERGVGPRDAVVAFDMLRYDSPKLNMLVFDAGPEAPALEEFGRALAFDDFRIQFPDTPGERQAAVQSAFAVFITHHRGGVAEALEAMIAGKPVVGWNTPELAEIVDDGATGFLVPVGDRAALGSRMRKLLEEPELAHRMGEAGRRRALERFSVHRMIEQYVRLYQELTE